ncbi:MAG: hypothetical protein HZC47_00270 [Methanobacterium sp.]|uniref:hypothetical protein n=1 Tax=Methanobacterium sp. TaxID=2164 RepID=UPI003D6473CB|nr:hypothetical protein [Methanobacterium sp.]
MAMCIFPSIGGAAENQTVDNNLKIGLNDNKSGLEVNAASKTKVKAKTVRKAKTTKKYKKTKATYKKSKKSKYRKVKAASRYKRSSYSSSSAGFVSDGTTDSIMKSGARYGYRRGVSSAASMQSAGAGDCWAMSEYLNSQFQSAGYSSRVVQYRTSYSSKHRSVQLNQNGRWVTVPYRAYGYNSMFV